VPGERLIPPSEDDDRLTPRVLGQPRVATRAQVARDGAWALELGEAPPPVGP
jgi:hypothetical protein